MLDCIVRAHCNVYFLDGIMIIKLELWRIKRSFEVSNPSWAEMQGRRTKSSDVYSMCDRSGKLLRARAFEEISSLVLSYLARCLVLESGRR